MLINLMTKKPKNAIAGNNQKYGIMSEEELKQELKGSVLILSTSSPDKRDIYREMFSSHNKGSDHYAGLDLFFTDSGALGIVPRKTPEKTGDYGGNLDEKSVQQIEMLKDKAVQKDIRSKLQNGGSNEFDYKTVNLMGMTEDSGWKLTFENKNIERKFIDKITEKIKPRLREKDYWLLKKIDENGFPGPNLKPVQEHLTGGFHELMELIYETAQELDIKNLRYQNSANISFVSPRLNKVFSKNFESSGDIMSKEEYLDKILKMKRGEPINSDFIQVPDGQEEGKRRNMVELERKGIFTKSSKDLPADFGRRELTEYLQNLIGKRRSSFVERKREVNIAVVTPDSVYGKKLKTTESLPTINDYKITGIPTYEELRKNPKQMMFGDADVVVLSSKLIDYNRNNDVYSDPNYNLLLKFAVTTITDPPSMNIPIVVDNRSGGFNRSLELISDAFAQGRLIGKNPFIVVNKDNELEKTLVLLKDVKQRAPVIKEVQEVYDNKKYEELQKVPSDGKFTVFIGGGHANKSKLDQEEAKELGYMAAKNSWRIATGAGSIEGSMGAVHTGFIQYHLDKLQKKNDLSLSQANKLIKKEFDKFKDKDGKYDAELIIEECPKFLEKLADNGQIPRNMFIGYSMKPLLEMESPSGKQPPAITYHEAGNMIRRLDALLAPGNKIFMPGSIGTDEELEDTIKQHINAIKLKKKSGVSGGNVFSDGTPDDKGTITIYNRGNIFDKVLRHYRLLGDDPFTEARKSAYNIKIVNSLDELKEVSKENAGSWADMIKKQKQQAKISR